MTIKQTTHSISTTSGGTTKVYRWEAASPKRGAVQIAHGMGEHALRYRPVSEALVRAGYDVYANDHRGHGSAASIEPNFGGLWAGRLSCGRR
jgi:alpha-beta hydrolase superfamily lysophospholipase